MTNEASWKPYAALVVLCFVWGTTYLAIRIGVETFPVYLFSGLRFLISGVLIFAWAAYQGQRLWPGRREWLRLSVSGLLIFTGGNLLLCIAEQELSSGLAALVNSSFPLWIVLITRIWNPREKTRLLTATGILVGFAGQWLIFSDHLSTNGNPTTLWAFMLLVWGVVNGAIGSIHMKKYPIHLNPALTGAWQMLIGGAITTCIGLWQGETAQLNSEANGWWAMLYLVIAGSIIGYSLFVYAMRHLPAQQVSVYAYVNPIVALFLGWLLLNEPVGMQAVYAMLVTSAGVYLVNRGMRG
jgi:drug/metabolite transporter (DMT)-like permease